MAQKSNHNQKIGKWGEQAAIDYLIKKGYTIKERNVFTPYGEIDIVAQHKDQLIFVEVKTRTGTSYGNPEEAVTPIKLSHFTNAAVELAARYNIANYQLDVIAILGKPSSILDITHFENI